MGIFGREFSLCAGDSVALLGLGEFSSVQSLGSSAIGGGDGVTGNSMIFEKVGFIHGLLST